MNVSKLISVVILCFVALMFILQFQPTLQSAVDNFTGGTNNEFVESMVGMLVWLLPIGGLVGIIYAIFTMVKGRKKG